jgi:SAM-dependent methyltransferase
MAYLHAHGYEVHGFDVVDHGVQRQGFLDQAAALLNSKAPGVDWATRLHAISVGDPWPFEAESFDYVVANQVLEHVHDHRRFLAENKRVMKEGGISYHLFPLKHYLQEGHLHIPFVHRIRSHDLREWYIGKLSKLDAPRHADYMAFLTNYLTEAECLDLAKAAGFRASFRHTSEFYAQKVRAVLRRGLRETYKARPIWDAFAVKLLRYFSSVTLRLEKRNTYASGKHD